MTHAIEPLSSELPLTPARTALEAGSALAVPPETLRAEAEAAVEYAREQHSAATRRAYATDFRLFECWCGERGLSSVPALPATVATFLAGQVGTGAKATTIARRIAAIRHAHEMAGHRSPTSEKVVRATIRGIRRALSVAPVRKTPATADRILEMVRLAPDTLAGRRDRAILLLGFAGAFRRSELAALTVADLEYVPEGLRVLVQRSKTDQEGEGQVVAIARGSKACPVEAVQAWLVAAGISEGAVFRPLTKGKRVLPAGLTPHSIAQVVKLYAQRAGFDPGEFGGHSLRAGFLTSAAARGASIFKMMDVSRHKSADTLRDYVRDAEVFHDHAGAGLL